jgi:ornithine decarboxylase
MPPTGPTTRKAAPVISWEEALRLVARYGTPLQVVSRPAVAANVAAFRNQLAGVTVCYAAKANRCPEILSQLQTLGISLDVCTPVEVKAGLAAGFTPDRMLHTHPCKTEDNLTQSYAAGVRWFVYDNADELPKIARLAPDAQVLLRVAAKSSADIDLSKKFGCDPDAVPALLTAAKAARVRVRGFSFHLGSQCLNPDDYGPVLAMIRTLYDAAIAAGHRLDTIDIGGGFPGPYKTPATIPSLGDYLSTVQGHLSQAFLGTGVKVLAEPGRAIVADAVTAVVRVIGKSVKQGRPWYVLDDGIYGTFSALFGEPVPYPILAANGAARPRRACVLTGPTCDSLDIIADDCLMPADLRVGEILLVPSVGAYSLVCATTFNGIELPRVVSTDSPVPQSGA